MEKTHIAFALAIFALGISYLSFTEQQYFSATAMIMIFTLALLSAATFVLAYRKYFDHSANGQLVLTILAMVSILLMYYDLSFNLVSPGVVSGAESAIFRVSFAVAVSIIFIYSIGRFARAYKEREKRLSKKALAVIAVCLIISSALAYEAMYAFNNLSWGGVDELAYNYYAAQLFLNGTNPYTQSMQPILNAHNIFPTVLLNGSYEYAYDYPALSFLSYVPVVALGVKSFYSFVAILVFLSVLASFTVYYKSGFNKSALIPLAAWLGLAFSLASVSNTFLAISVFLLFAYIYKENPIYSGILLGLAASVTQVAWFALPFFYVLALRHHGLKGMRDQILASFGIFVLINIYFVALSPAATMGNIFALFGAGKLPFYGPNLMQFFVSFFPMPNYATEVASGLAMLWALAMLYLYVKSAKTALALAPAFVFFITWRNISIYAIPYIPILLLMFYHKDRFDAAEQNQMKSKRLMACSAIAVILVVLAVMLYAHYSYMSEDTLHINQMMPVVIVGFNNYTGSYQFALGGIYMNMTNNGQSNETVSFLMVSRSPNNEAYVLGTTVKTLPPMGTANYTLHYQLPMINNSTKLFVVAFSKDYVTSKELDVSINYKPQSMP
jgi:uncharacterized membrane protein